MIDKEYRVILASRSPRRRELLGKICEGFEIMTCDVDETLPEGMHPSAGVGVLAIRKGAPIAAEAPDAIVISSDTLVELDGVPLGKPESREHAASMLSMLSGRIHNVHTGVAVHYKGQLAYGVATSRVEFYPLSLEEIQRYIEGGEPMDKAGAYGIQGEGGKFVKEYIGDFDTIMGLSVSLTEKLVSEVLSKV